jgi:hypothetical protein
MDFKALKIDISKQFTSIGYFSTAKYVHCYSKKKFILNAKSRQFVKIKNIFIVKLKNALDCHIKTP